MLKGNKFEKATNYLGHKTNKLLNFSYFVFKLNVICLNETLLHTYIHTYMKRTLLHTNLYHYFQLLGICQNVGLHIHF